MRGWAITSWVGVAGLAVGLAAGIAQANPRAITALSIHFAVALVAVLTSQRSGPLTGLFVLSMDVNAMGWGWRWHDVVWRYDDLAHAFVTLTLTGLVGSSLLRPLRTELLARRRLLALLLISVGLTGSVLWELFEWLCDHFVVPPRQMSIVDTMSDLLSDLVGAVLAVPLGIHALKQPGPDQPSAAPGEPGRLMESASLPGDTADVVP